MSYCSCPFILRASRKKKDGTIEYAKALGLKCFVIKIHETGCQYRKKVKAAS